MQISRRSWHYRFILWMWNESIPTWLLPWWYQKRIMAYSPSTWEPSRNLCAYCWTLLFFLSVGPPIVLYIYALIWLSTLLVLLGGGLYTILRLLFRFARRQKACPIIEFVD